MKDNKLVLVVDLDKTLLHSTNSLVVRSQLRKSFVWDISHAASVIPAIHARAPCNMPYDVRMLTGC